MRWLLPPLVIFLGCAHAPPPVPKPELPLAGVRDLAGKYTDGNDLDWGYFLEIEADGKLDLRLDRGKLGRCEQRGKLLPGADTHTFALTYDRNECVTDHVAGQKVSVHVESFTGDALVLAITGDGIDEHRHYRRRPASAK